MAIVRADLLDMKKSHEEYKELDKFMTARESVDKFKDNLNKIVDGTERRETNVNDLIGISNHDYDQFAEYTKDFDFSHSEFIKTLMKVVLDKLLENPIQEGFFIEIEKDVQLHFGRNFTTQAIFMIYDDTRFNSIIEYQTPKERPRLPLYHNIAESEFDKHQILNKPIIHHVYIIHKRNEKDEEYVDVEKTLESLINDFVVFANVIDIEHKAVLWVAEKEEERKLQYNTNYSDRSLPDLSLTLGLDPRIPEQPIPSITKSKCKSIIRPSTIKKTWI